MITVTKKTASRLKEAKWTKSNVFTLTAQEILDELPSELIIEEEIHLLSFKQNIDGHNYFYYLGVASYRQYPESITKKDGTKNITEALAQLWLGLKKEGGSVVSVF